MLIFSKARFLFSFPLQAIYIRSKTTGGVKRTNEIVKIDISYQLLGYITLPERIRKEKQSIMAGKMSPTHLFSLVDRNSCKNIDPPNTMIKKNNKTISPIIILPPIFYIRILGFLQCESQFCH